MVDINFVKDEVLEGRGFQRFLRFALWAIICV